MNKAMLCSFVPWVTRARKYVVGCASPFLYCWLLQPDTFLYVCHHWSPNPFTGCPDCRSKRPTTHQQRLVWRPLSSFTLLGITYHTILACLYKCLDPPVAATPRVVARAESQLHVRRRRRSNSWSGTKRVQSSSWNGSLDKLLGLRAQ